MKYLAIGPGAMTYFVFLGALAALRDSDQLQNLEEISGASAGALLAFFYIVTDGNIKTIIDYSLNIPIKDIMKPNIKLFIKNFGLISHKKIRLALKDIIHIFFGKDNLTFGELYKLKPNNPKLHVTSYCVNLDKTMYFSVDTSPTMSIIDALCMSIAVPFLFASVEYNNQRFTDGATCEEAPVNVFLGKTDVKLLQVVWKKENIRYHPLNFKDYMTSMLMLTTRLRHKYSTFPAINIDVSKFDMFDFSMSTSSKLKMFMFGYQQTSNPVQELKSCMISHPEEDLPIEEPPSNPECLE